MTDTKTFPALLSQLASTTGRGGLAGSKARQQLVGYARHTMKECHMLGFFDDDLVETEVITTASPHIWTRPSGFRKVSAVQYPNFIFPKFKRPGRLQKGITYYFYAATDYFVFVGLDTAETIKIAYYAFARNFIDYTKDAEPAKYDDETETWLYLNANGEYVSALATTELEDTAQAKVTNWMLSEYFAVIIEGTMAKFLKSYNDKRAPSTFAVYTQMQKTIVLDKSLDVQEVA